MKFTSSSDIEQHTQLDANVGGHPGNMRSANSCIGNTRYDSILDSHQKAEAKDQNGAAFDGWNHQFGPAEQDHESGFGENTDRINTSNVSSTAGVNQQRRYRGPKNKRQYDG